ncbi:MAG: nitroreductase family protein [Lachnospiraceae bacterium]
MNTDLLYDMIFKRKSFHLFRDGEGSISDGELDSIYEYFSQVSPLVSDIRTGIRIVPADDTTCKRGEEYCILLYSECKDYYLQNIGYIGEQIDLFLASKNIGALWFGIGKTEETAYDGLDFVIMIAIARMPEDKFRKDMFKAKRKPLDEIWSGSVPEYANVVRFAPSACNTQPWIVENEENSLKIYRYKKPGKRGIMPVDKVTFYNRIDIGIFLCFLDICLAHDGQLFDRKLYIDNADDDTEKVLVAEYVIKEPR